MKIEILKQGSRSFLVSILSGDLASGNGLFESLEEAEKEARRLAKLYAGFGGFPDPVPIVRRGFKA